MEGRQVKEGLAGIENLAVEVKKTESNRNWKSILDNCQSVLDVAAKATDLTQKLGPFLPVVVSLIEKAKQML